MLGVGFRTATRDQSAPTATPATSALVELAGGLGLVAASLALDGDALRGVVLVLAAGLVVARAGLGAAQLGPPGLVTWGALGLIQALLLVPGIIDPDRLPVLAALAGLGVTPLVAGTLPALRLPGLTEGRREDLTPGLLAAAVGGGVGVLVAITLAGAIDVGDDRLGELMPYVAAGGALLALAEVLSLHRAGARFAETPAVLTVAPVGLQILVLLDPGGSAVDDAVTAMVVASAAAAIGLLVSTALASPRPLAVPVEAAGDGPRQVAWAVAGLLGAAAVARLASPRDLWLDEATLANVTASDSLGRVFDSAEAVDAHPPLLDLFMWLSRQLLGDGDLALRLPSLLAGLLLVPAVYVAAGRLYDRRVALVAATVAALGPGLVWLSSSARPGTLAALLSALALFTMLRAVDEGRLADWVLFGVTGAALIWAHQLGFLHVAVLEAGAAAFLWRTRVTGLAPETRGPPRVSGASPAGLALAAGLTLVAFVALLAYRGGLGPPDLLPPLEYATEAAPGAGQSIFGLVGTGVVAVLGFHPEDVTSRLLALWPLSILVVFVLAVRAWTRESVLLVALSAAPFVALLVAQIAGAPRNPPFALEWIATAVPMLAIGVGRVVTLWGSWSRARALAMALAAVLAVAAVDQTTRVEPLDRFVVTPAVEEVAARAGEGDVVIYAPDLLGDLIRHEAPEAEAVAASEAAEAGAPDAARVFVVGAFGFMEEGSAGSDATLGLVDELAGQRSVAQEEQFGETKVWRFE